MYISLCYYSVLYSPSYHCSPLPPALAYHRMYPSLYSLSVIDVETSGSLFVGYSVALYALATIGSEKSISIIPHSFTGNSKLPPLYSTSEKSVGPYRRNSPPLPPSQSVDRRQNR